VSTKRERERERERERGGRQERREGERNRDLCEDGGRQRQVGCRLVRQAVSDGSRTHAANSYEFRLFIGRAIVADNVGKV